MKHLLPHRCRSRRRGGATLAVVAAISLAMISMLTYTVISALNSFDAQTSAQIKQDYSQKEDAVLTALLHIVPNKAIGAMKRNSANNPDDYTWETIFDEAIAVANAEQSISPNLLTSLQLDEAIIANTGDAPLDDTLEVVNAPVRSYAGGENLVNGGNWWEFFMLQDNEVGPRVPAPLRVSYNEYLLDKEYPIITFNKQHVYNYEQYHPLYYKGLFVSTDEYPLYNLYRYPDVRFGYKKPGELFVAKRNWWTFSLTFGRVTEEQTGIPAVTKNYVLSIYEIPTQLPLSASALMKVGKFADGSDWSNVALTGGIYADALETEGTVALTDGALSARSSVALSDGTSVDGSAVDKDFAEMGKREARGLESNSDFYVASVAGNVGKVAFIPLNPGYDFLKRSSDGNANQRISPTGWKDYTRGANQAVMRLDIHEMISLDTQIPTKVRLYYRTTGGGTTSIDFERGENWPTEIESGGENFAIQTAVLQNERNALVLNLDRFPDFIESLPNAAGIEVNNSIYVSPVNSELTVQAPSFPTLDSDCCLTLRGGQDMTAYTKGFSIVTDIRMYIGETINNVATTPPAASGLPVDADYYPPVSLFAPEKRFGESPLINRPLTLRGQLSSLKTSTSDTFNPLELIMADEERVDTDLLDADLVGLRSPAELPPVHLMNWMVTIEEIH